MGMMENKLENEAETGFMLPSVAVLHMGGCQNCGPVLDPYYNTAPNI